MKDIFDAKISCRKCGVEMKQTELEKSGFILRAIECLRCNERIVHPEDLNKLKDYKDLKRKTYSVKLRMVGNSHAISIPKEIVDFINDANHKVSKHMGDMVELCFEDFGKLSLSFFGEDRRRKRWE